MPISGEGDGKSTILIALVVGVIAAILGILIGGEKSG
jgi:hypothetical protein